MQHHPLRLTPLALLDRLADAEHGDEASFEDAGAFARGLDVGLAEDVTALRVADEDELGARIGSDGHRALPSECSLLLGVHVLHAEPDVHARRRCLTDGAEAERGREEDDGPVIVRGELRGEHTHEVGSGGRAEVHLPVPREDGSSESVHSATGP